MVDLLRHTDEIGDEILKARMEEARQEWIAACALTGVEYKGEPVQAIDSPAGAEQIAVRPQSEEGVGK